MKKLASFVLALGLALAVTGCWGDPKPSSQPIPSPTPGHSQSSSVLPSESAAEGTIPGTGADSAVTSSARRAAATAAAPDGEDMAFALRLVNSDHPLEADFDPPLRLIEGYDSRFFDVRAADSLEAMLQAAADDGCPLYLASGYRSEKRQQGMFARRTQRLIKTGVDQRTAQQQIESELCRPGESEHNLGLAADIVSRDWYSHHLDLVESFDTTDSFHWLEANAADYGFILRYPKNKQHITGISYKPWHYRYVGKAAAAEITNENLTLEEYCLKKGLAQ